MLRSLERHWPEYLIEAAGLGAFRVSAGVFAALLRITSLTATAGPAIELLESLAPRDGRPTPIDTRANDLWYGQTHLQVVGARAGEDVLRGRWWVSPGWVEVDGAALGIVGGMMNRDADGHAMLLFSTADQK